MSYAELAERKQAIQRRLSEITVPGDVKKAPPPSKKSKLSLTNVDDMVVPLREKTDTHWDFVMKEMMWLATDFIAERKRHASGRRKLANAAQQHFSKRESRQVRELAQAELKRRRLAGKLGRQVKAWWIKMDRVVSYKQKLSADEQRRLAMNQQLVALVKQTERYSESLVRQQQQEYTSDSSESDSDSDHSGSSPRQRRKRHRRRYRLTIEQALANAAPTRRSKQRVKDYARLNADENEQEFYGESTASEESDASYTPIQTHDDETTLLEALQHESMEQKRQQGLDIDDEEGDASSFVADPLELQRLEEEAEMDIDEVLERLRNEALATNVPDAMEIDDDAKKTASSRRVKFAETKGAKLPDEPVQPATRKRPLHALPDPGSDADDDADASDVEDFVVEAGDNEDEEEEFQPEAGTDVDDETTMEAEERLGRDMSYEQEIALLQNEGEMPIEQLRAMYASLEQANVEEEEPIDEDETEDTEERPGLQELLSVDDTGEEEEFCPAAGTDVDDETTMEAEERLGRDMSYEQEIALLQNEGEMPIEQLRAMYASMEQGNVDDEEVEPEDTEERPGGLQELLSVDDTGEEEEFQPEAGTDVDDETTMEAEERLGRDMSYEQEIALLQNEGEMPIEQLRAMYAERGGTDEPRGPTSDESSEEEIVSKQSKKRKREGQRDSDADVSDAGKAALDALEASAERARKTLASRPYLLAPWVKLREYQQIGLNWLVSLQSRRLNGILADEMGLGKTLQTISLLAYLAAYKGIWGPHLIVVPTSVIVNWETEFKRFCPGLKVLCYYGSARRRKELRTGWTKTNWYHVVITSYQLAVQDAFAFKRKRWYYLVLDEAQNIKNFQSQRWQTLINFNSQRRLLLTGTPLQNNLMELWSLLHFLMPYIFRSRKEFSYWFASPMSSMIEGTSNQNDEVVSRLHGIIRPFVLRRLKKDVETQMPGKFEHIVKCQLSRRQMFIYEEFMARSSTRQALKKGGNFMGMMNVLMQLRKVCNHPDLFEPRSVVTPFVFDPIDMSTAAFIPDACDERSLFDRVGDHLYVPLWCGSNGEPSVEASMRHDVIEASELRRLEASIPVTVDNESDEELDEEGHDYVPALRELWKSTRATKRAEKTDKKDSLNQLNSWRCRPAPFAYPSRVVEAVKVPSGPLDATDDCVLSTPAHLLAMRRTQQERAEDVDDLVKKFVFCVPKAGTRRYPILTTKAPTKGPPEEKLPGSLEELERPFRHSNARLSSFFPDKKLVQYDAGKLQTLAELLRELKRTGHRVLIFTQMSKMLDILEAFLNLNGYTYLRLDGSTGVDRRQRLMDRFNNDTKIFCFILSTRSGGLGINLTGADTVVFYDSDWNPAMDAQAQDRAHRIGQTREVHIYRLITEHSIEENILTKAKQKRNLDILVMDKGKFDASQLGRREYAKASDQPDEVKDVYTKGGLRAILGVTEEAEVDSGEAEKEKEMSTEQMETAMTTLEDVDDVQALRGAQKEAAEELREFDETVELGKDSDEADSEQQQTSEPKAKANDKGQPDLPDDQKKEEEELEKEFAAWQSKVGLDASAIEASLSPTERYGLHFREEIDPYYSIFAVMEYRRKMEASEPKDEIDIDEIEKMKAKEEKQAMDDGDLLATRTTPEDLVRQRNLYQREKSRLRADKKRRKLTGENWECRTDGVTQHPFWYNVDTGEAVWDKPHLLLELEELETANEKGWSAIPIKALVHVMGFLLPFPDRMRCGEVCRRWKRASHDISFVRHVYPVEMGALTREDKKMEQNHYRTISEAVAVALPGDTIELGDGHYWLNEDLTIDIPLRLVGDEHNPSNVIIETAGTLHWRGKGGWFEGVTFRRPRLSAGEPTAREILRIEGGARLDMTQSLFDNGGSRGATVTVTGVGSTGHWENVHIKGGKGAVEIKENATLDFPTRRA